MSSLSNNCIMCKEVDGSLLNTPLQTLAGDIHRFVDETNHFVAMPSIGALCSGYLLVVPKRHVTSFSQLTKTEFDELDFFLSKIKKALFSIYQAQTLTFEHGIIAPISRRIKHAHLHIMPDVSKFGTIFLKSVRTEIGEEGIRIKNLWNVTQFQYPVYVFVETSEEKWLFKDNDDRSNRMHLRKKIAEIMGHPNSWDWELYPNQNFIQETLLEFKKL